MAPLAMALLLTVALAGFAHSARRRWRLMMIGGPDARFDRPARRLRLTLRFALGQARLTRYPLAGLAHAGIFAGFLVLLLRSLILFGRGFAADPDFGYWILDGGTVPGDVYAAVKDVCVMLVIAGVAVFLWYRVLVKPRRMTLNREGILILVLILALMGADVVYDAAAAALAAAEGGGSVTFRASEPLGSLLAAGLPALPGGLVKVLWHAGFWAHVVLVLVFLNLLPYSKHFHVITAVPNVFFQELAPTGRLRPIADLEGRVEREETLGVRRIGDLSWKGILDLYSCTECGRCTDHCPASRTGKLLSPKQLTVDVRDFLYRHESALIARGGPETEEQDDEPSHRGDLVPGVIRPEVLWACTTCGACEQECPVLISYVDKIVDLRRHLAMERGDLPGPLQQMFQNLETTGSPYGVPPEERLRWAEGLDGVPVRSEIDDAHVDVLFWVGCAAATDERAGGIARAVARLLNHAGVKWAVLGPEERCTGDVARRAGNEYLFQMMAEANVETLDTCGARTIVTACPHCFNTLEHEYPDFGGRYEVVHHTAFLARLVAEGRLVPEHSVPAKIAYHDSCYLGRYNGVFDPPRTLLESIPGVEVVEAEPAARDRGMCCGAGGAQMFKEEEEGTERVSAARGRQLVETGADAIGTACPFCLRMLTDAVNALGREEVDRLDVAEVLLKSIDGGG